MASAGRMAPTSVKICPATSRRVYPTSSSRARSGSSRTSHTTWRNRPNFEGARFQESNPGNSYDIGVALEYILNPQWRFSAGYLHTEIQGMKSYDLLPEAPELDANSVAVGLVYSPIERLSLTLGAREVVVRLGEDG